MSALDCICLLGTNSLGTYMDRPPYFGGNLLLISYRQGIKTGLVVGAALWTILFLPLTTFGILPKLDSYVASAPNQYIFEISSHFQGLYPVIIIGSLIFHLLYGLLLGFLAGRMTELGTFVTRKEVL